jgi:hypothetical protein
MTSLLQSSEVAPNIKMQKTGAEVFTYPYVVTRF